MRILGINSVFHESSAAIVADGVLVAAAEEERFNRRKHGAEARIDNADELPLESIRYCLEQAGLTAEELDAVCYSFDPQLRSQNFVADPYAVPKDWGSTEGEEIFRSSVLRVPEVLSDTLDADLTERFHWVSHHEAHAASSYVPSGFPEASVVVIDGIGEQLTALLGHWDGETFTTFRRHIFPHSLGFLWEKLSSFLGFSEYDAPKVMGLAAYGNPAVYRSSISELVTIDSDGFRINADAARFRCKDFESIAKIFGVPDSLEFQNRADIAASLQESTNEIVMSLARQVHSWRPADALCLAGGVALNCHTNWKLLRDGPHQQVYVPSAPHDAGTAQGAALAYGQQVAVPRLRGGPQLRSAYLGPEYSDAAMEESLRRRRLSFEVCDDPAAAAAQLLSSRLIVAWFQGRMEFGPRALGNRSLLADPRQADTREVLNYKVKHREPFRPFAPSVLAEHATDWFELAQPSDSYAYMSFACPVRPGLSTRIPAVVHQDGTARVQVVTREANPLFHRLISRFHDATGVPLVLNTSFNDSEPIVCSPDDAISTFLATRIDALVLGRYLVRRP
ncbi:MAG: carbamoyltransferase family protein [Streptosporangiaceae bacterium]